MPRKSAIQRRIEALPEDVRDRVLERAAILWEAGTPEEDVDRLALEQEAAAAAPSVARARSRPAAGEPAQKKQKP